MRLAFRSSLLAIGLASSFGAGAASAGSLVEFPNVSEQAPRLVGYLARPDRGLSALLGAGAGRSSADRYPAVVVLHGCSGISSHSAEIADRLGSWGMWRWRSTAWGRAASPTAAPAAGIRNKRSTLTQHCVTWGSSFSSMPRGSPFLANRWAVLRRFTPSITIWRHNILPSAFGLRSPITRRACSQRCR